MKKFAFTFLLWSMICGQISLSQQRSEGSKPIVLKGASIITGSGGTPLADAVIVIEGDKIKAVAPKGANYPADATVIDLSGKFVIPGLIDSHTPWAGAR